MYPHGVMAIIFASFTGTSILMGLKKLAIRTASTRLPKRKVCWDNAASRTIFASPRFRLKSSDFWAQPQTDCLAWRVRLPIKNTDTDSSKCQPNKNPQPFLIKGRAAGYLAMATSTFLELVREGALPAGVKVRGMRVWDRFELDSAFDELKAKSHAQKTQPV
jgi:hypothetical protein